MSGITARNVVLLAAIFAPYGLDLRAVANHPPYRHIKGFLPQPFRRPATTIWQLSHEVGGAPFALLGQGIVPTPARLTARHLARNPCNTPHTPKTGMLSVCHRYSSVLVSYSPTYFTHNSLLFAHLFPSCFTNSLCFSKSYGHVACLMLLHRLHIGRKLHGH